jgi:hypothetical protein
MDDLPEYAKFSEPAYSVPETVDYTKLTESDEAEHGDGPGFDNENELPESDYPEEGDEDGEA